MPLTSKGEEIKSALQKEYGAKKGEQVLYAGANKGTFTGIHNDRRDKMNNDVESPRPESGPMATGGPNGTSENLPKTVEPFSKVTDNSPGMSLDAIKVMGKRIGRY
jgi:hypothetical protein